MWFDVIIRNGRILDGAGNPWFKSNIGIKHGTIKKIGSLNTGKASKTIDAKGLVVCPGFIDIHNHSDFSMLVDPKMESKVKQGVTTEVNGNCGGSPAPINENVLNLRKLRQISEDEVDWTTMDGYFKRLEKQGISQNAITQVGHGTVRYYVMGDAAKERTSSPSELEEMKLLVKEAMEDGAVGLSTGLDYAPGCYAHTDELIELSKVVANYGGIYSSHLRESSSKVLGWMGEQGSYLESVAEAIDIGRKSGVFAVQLSHISGHWVFKHDTEMTNKVRSMIDSAREEGINVTADVLPSNWGSVAEWPGRSVFPPSYYANDEEKEKLFDKLSDPEERAKLKEELMNKPISELGYENTAFRLLCIREGRGDSIKIFPPFNEHLKNQEYEYKTLDEIAQLKKKDLLDTLFDLLVEEDGKICVCHNIMDYDLVMSQLTWPTTMPSSDGGSIEKPGKLAEKRVRPTAWAGFPMALEWVREEKLVTLEDMVRRMTSMPARTLGLKDRGLIKKGFWADITIIDPDTVKSNCTYENDCRPEFPIGIPYVIVNGQLVIEESEHTGILPGKVLRHPF